MEHSVDVVFAVDRNLTQNHENPWIIYSLWSSAIFDKNVTNIKSFLAHHLKVLFVLITMAQFPASYLVPIRGYNMSFFRQYIYRVGVMPAKYYAKYLGLGRRYAAGICTIVISMSGAFQ